MRVRVPPPAPCFPDSHMVFVALAALAVKSGQKIFSPDFGCTLAVWVLRRSEFGLTPSLDPKVMDLNVTRGRELASDLERGACRIRLVWLDCSRELANSGG